MAIRLDGVSEPLLTIGDYNELIGAIKNLRGDVKSRLDSLGSDIQTVNNTASRAQSTADSAEQRAEQALASIKGLEYKLSSAARDMGSLANQFDSYHATNTKGFNNINGDILELTEETRSSIANLNAQIREFSEMLDYHTQDTLSSALESLQDRVQSTSAQVRRSYEELGEVSREASQAQITQIQKQIGQVRENNLLRNNMLRTLERSNQLTFSLDKTFDRYHQDSVSRTRIREAIEAEALLETGRKELQANQFSMALKSFQDAELRMGGDPRPRLGIASAFIGLEEWVKARNHLEETIDMGTPDGNAVAMLSRVYLALGQFTKAEGLITEFMDKEQFEAYREGCELYKILGVVYYHSDRVLEAFSTFREAEKLDKYGDPELKALMIRIGENETANPIPEALGAGKESS